MLPKCGYGHYVVSVTKILWQSKNFVLKTNILNCSSCLFSFYCVIPELTFRQLLDDMNSGKTTLKNLHDLQVYNFSGWKWSLIHSKFRSNKECWDTHFLYRQKFYPHSMQKKITYLLPYTFWGKIMVQHIVRSISSFVVSVTKYNIY